MSDRATWIVGFGHKLRQTLRWPGDLKESNRLRASIRQAEIEGLQFAFYARLTAIIVVTAWLFSIVPWPRDLYYGTYALVFFILGYIPYRLRHHTHGEAIKLGFIVLDVALVTTAILVPPPVAVVADWPVQIRLRGQEFLYVLLLLAEAALTYSPRRVVWTGLSILVIWSIGVFTIHSLPDTLRFNDVAAEGSLTSASVLDLIFQPTFVGLTSWYTQLVATALFTLLITLTVWRSRRTLVQQVETEVVRADLARYVSPDVASALTKRGGTDFGDPDRGRTVCRHCRFHQAHRDLFPESDICLAAQLPGAELHHRVQAWRHARQVSSSGKCQEQSFLKKPNKPPMDMKRL
ncbi:hypothetical protein [Microvirga sp. KLBC 81]|uniref:hypothetical protein n=1 Tax=Microvirga sp. KLBC 81 TaxID=1862707 RepID=UPI001FE164B0|nr:hypothetical protein [Microvirga sp. KLBC 81]